MPSIASFVAFATLIFALPECSTLSSLAYAFDFHAIGPIPSYCRSRCGGITDDRFGRGESCASKIPRAVGLLTGRRSTAESATALPSAGRFLPSAASSFVDDNALRSVPPDSVLTAIHSASSADGRIVAPDLAAAAGISLSQAGRDLQTLASITGAGMAATESGELVYTFPRDLRGALRRRSARYRARALAKRTWPGVFYGIRVGFGAMMLLSLLTIFASLAALSAVAEAGAGDDNDEGSRRRGGQVYGGADSLYGGRRGGGLHFHFGQSLFNSWFGPSPFDVFFYRPYYGYYGRRRRHIPLYGTYTINPWGGGPVAQRKQENLMGRTSEGEVEDEPDMSFLEAFYSYVFGDGDPNADVDARLLCGAAAVIRSNGGTVTAEQLAPFLLDPPSPDLALAEYNNDVVRTVDESYVLPIVTKLGGEPTVTEEGDIVYVFPEMAKTAGAGDAESIDSELSWLIQQTRNEVEDAAAARTVSVEAVQEQEVGFSLAGPGQRAAAAALGVVNLMGALALGRALASPRLSGVKLIGMLGFVQQSYPLILSYAVLYNAIPLARYVRLKRRNRRIRQRNSNRGRWANKLRSAVGGAGSSIGRKLKAARGMAQRIRRVDKEEIFFDTIEDEIDRRKRMQEKALEEFDEQLLDEE